MKSYLLSLLFLPASLIAQTLIEPRLGIETPKEVHAEFSAEIKRQAKIADDLRLKLKDQPKLLKFLPDAEIFYESVKRTLEDQIFYTKKQFDVARNQLKMGSERLEQLSKGKTPWNSQTGLVVRGYVSKIDGSLQPYGLVVPESYKPKIKPLRLDIWQHGRSNKLSEVAFIDQRLNKPGIFTPKNTIVLHPYGRYCNAMKFAGEVDTFEAMDSVKYFYPIDEDRICMRGFSMGGAAAWHFGAHYADQWVAVNPGAGFVDVEIYQGLKDKLDTIPWYEKKMWSFYDPLAVAVNLENTTVVAYSGEEDKQKQAADLMEAALAKEGHKIEHIIGPKTGHKYEPKAKEKVAKLVDEAAQNGKPQQPAKVRLTTSTLKYYQMHWITLDGLEKHWEMARVEGELKQDGVHLTTRNVNALSLLLKGIHGKRRTIHIDGQQIGPYPDSASPRDHWTPHIHKADGTWKLGYLPKGLRKKHNLQGPIDDAFMAPFLVVTPSQKSLNPTFDKWVEREIKEFTYQWRKQFRGEPRIKKDSEVTLEDVKNYNLILFGNPRSNEKLFDMIYKLPYRWKKTHFEVNGKEYSFDTHAPAMIYPNPENPDRYIVINSGFTFAAAGKASNSRQTPRLPDWAVLDLKVTPLDRADGTGVVDAGFFDENWKWKTR